MNKQIKSIVCIIFALLLCIMNSVQVNAITREENLYYKLDNSGNVYKNLSTEKETSENNIPIKTEIKYYLNDKEISSSDIKGKSGNVKIEISLKNTCEKIVNINGKEIKMYIPYIVACGMIIDNNKFKNITISNGKIIDNGNDSLIIGIALPGMQENLELSETDIHIPSSIIIEADAENFELDNMYMYVESDIFNTEKLDFLDEFKKIYSDMNNLKNASTKLIDGTEELKEGMILYSEKMTEFNMGLSKYTTGVSTISSSYSKINDGITSINTNSKKIEQGSKKISAGITELKTNITTLISGFATIMQSLDNINNGTGRIIDKVDESINTISTSTSKNSETYKQLETLGVNTETNIYKLNTTVKQLEEVVKKLDDECEEKTVIISTIESINKQIADLKSNVAIERAGYSKAIETETKGVLEGLTQLKDALKQLQNGTTQLKVGINDNILSKTPELQEGLNSLEGGANELANGAGILSNGVNTLANGSSTLKTGIETLNLNSNTLSDASTQLKDGANELANGTNVLNEGMKEFNDNGINKIYNLVNGDIKNVQTRLEKLVALSDKNEDSKSYKYILKIDSIK